MESKSFFLLIAFLCAFSLPARPQDPESIKKQMTQIRQSTNWKDKEAAAKANQEISKLARQLMMTKAVPKDSVGVPAEGQTTEEAVDLKLQLWDEIWGSIRQGENADLDLARPVREIIKKEYEEDSDHSVKSPELLDNVSILTLNMSMPGIDAVISQMPNFRNIRTLVIVCEQPVPVDLGDILDKASGYPLEQLFVFNFGPMVTSIPGTIGNFRKLNEISLIGNQVTSLPETMAGLPNLRKLYVSVNPLSTIVSALSPAQKMSEIALQDTNITEEEKATLRQMFPGCTIIE